MSHSWRRHVYVFLLGLVLQRSLLVESSLSGPIILPQWESDNNNNTTRTRVGVLDQVIVNDKNNDNTTTASSSSSFQQQQQYYQCHIASFLPWTWLRPTGRVPFRVGAGPVMASAIVLALEMLQRGDGSVISELTNIHQTCPIRFTTEFVDSQLLPSATVDQTIQLLSRTGGDNNNDNQYQVCAFLGAGWSGTTIPMATLTGLYKRVQLTYSVTSTVLDNKQHFPLFGRLIPSDEGVVLPFLWFLKERGVKHLGVVHFNDDGGNAYARALLNTATQYYPELKVMSVDIGLPTVSTKEDYQKAVQILKGTQFRWFLGVVEGSSSFPPLMEAAVEAGIAGTGEHTWIFSDILGVDFFQSLQVERNSPLGRAAQGIGRIASQGGRPGMDVYDRFVTKWKAMAGTDDNHSHGHNNSDYYVDLIDSLQPLYPDEPNYPGRTLDKSLFDADPSRVASIVFDEIVMMALAACRALQTQDNNNVVTGDAMFKAMLQTSFQGATGNVTLDPTTGNRLPMSATYRLENIVHAPINDTHVAFRPQVSQAFVNGKWLEQIPYVFNDGTTNTPSDLPTFQINDNHLDKGIRIAGLVMAAVILLLSAALAAWTVYRRKDHVVRASQPIFLILLCAGAFVMGSAIIPLSIDDSNASTEGCSAACMAVPWLGSSGWALLFAALFSKTWRINRLFNNPLIKRVKVTALDVMFPLIGLLVLNVIVMIIWNIVSPLEWVREVTELDVFGRPMESHGYCTSEHFLPFAIALVVMDMGALMFTLYQSYLARGIATEFAESEYITRAIGLLLLVSFVGIPVMVMVSDSNPSARFFVSTCIIFVVCTSVLLFIFVPKILLSSSENLTESIKKSVSQLGLGDWRSSELFAVQSTDDNIPGTDSEPNESSTGDDDGLRILDRPGTLRHVLNENRKLKSEMQRLETHNTQLQQQIAELQALVPEHDQEHALLRLEENLFSA